jgi:hypothetical protein
VGLSLFEPPPLVDKEKRHPKLKWSRAGSNR